MLIKKKSGRANHIKSNLVIRLCRGMPTTESNIFRGVEEDIVIGTRKSGIVLIRGTCFSRSPQEIDNSKIIKQWKFYIFSIQP